MLATEPLIRIEGIAKRFGGTTVFEDLHFSIEPGEFVCLIGHSGCGKTTILNVLASLDQASEGYVFVAFVFWIACFSMSRWSASLEKQSGETIKKPEPA